MIEQRNNVLLGTSHQRASCVTEWRSPDGRQLTVLYGSCIRRDPAYQPVNATGVGELYIADGVKALLELDGSFVLVVIDRTTNILLVVRDRTGSIPMVWAQGSSGVAFGPEAKALFQLTDIRPKLDRLALLSFVNLGYPIAQQTMFDGVQQLAPGHALELRLDACTASTRQYWDLSFRPERKMSLPDAIDALDAALNESHRASLCDDPGETQLLLTGGFDSRIVLGYLSKQGKPPSTTLTWGVSDQIPSSDPAIARTVANVASVSHRFLYYGAESFVEHAADWALKGELSSDNLGNYAAGAGFFEREGVDPSLPVFIGDQMLGPGTIAGNAAHAAENITKLRWQSLRPEIAQLMGPQRRDAEKLVWDAVQGVMAGCQSDHPKDMQDYLFFHLYVVRWLYAPAYFREPMVSPRRPLMLQPTIELGRRLPRRYRVDKRILVDLLRDRLPHLAEIPTNSAHSLVDWGYETRAAQPFRECLIDLLAWKSVEATALRDVLNERTYKDAVARYFSQVPHKINRRPSALPAALRWRTRLAGVPLAGRALRAIQPFAKRALGRNNTDQTGQILLRIALVSLLGRLINEGRIGGENA